MRLLRPFGGGLGFDGQHRPFQAAAQLGDGLPGRPGQYPAGDNPRFVAGEGAGGLHDRPGMPDRKVTGLQCVLHGGQFGGELTGDLEFFGGDMIGYPQRGADLGVG